MTTSFDNSVAMLILQAQRQGYDAWLLYPTDLTSSQRFGMVTILRARKSSAARVLSINGNVIMVYDDPRFSGCAAYLEWKNDTWVRPEGEVSAILESLHKSFMN